MISLIILNWKRPNNIEKHILPYLEDNKIIDEIIISHGRKESVFNYESKKKNIIHRYDHELNKNFGLSLRFLAALTSKNKFIMFMDDDEIISNQDIETSYYKLKNNTKLGIVGKYGRKFYKNGQNYIYNYHNYSGISDIILTKFMILRKNVIYDFFSHSMYVEYLQTKAKPLWNGEDIFISLLARKRYGNQALYSDRDIKGKKLDELGVSVSLWSGHQNFRQYFYNNCLKILNIE